MLVGSLLVCWRESSPKRKSSTHTKSCFFISILAHIALQCSLSSPPLWVRNTDNILMTHFVAQLKASISWKSFWIETTCGRCFQTLMPLQLLIRPEISSGFVWFFILFSGWFFLDSIHALICSQGACFSLKVYGKTCLCKGFTHVHTLVILYVTYIQCCHRCQT